MGPLTLNDASWGADDSLQVFDNVHGWQNATGGASLLFLEHPAPTGFSFCEPADACSHDDDSQAELHLEILEAFFSDVCVRRADISLMNRGDAAAKRRGYSVEASRGDAAAEDVDISWDASRGDAAAATWTFRGDESRRRLGCDVDISTRTV